MAFWWALLANGVSGGFFPLRAPLRRFDNPVFLWKSAFLLPAIIVSYLVYEVSVRSEDMVGHARPEARKRKIAALLSPGL